MTLTEPLEELLLLLLLLPTEELPTSEDEDTSSALDEPATELLASTALDDPPAEDDVTAALDDDAASLVELPPVLVDAPPAELDSMVTLLLLVPAVPLEPPWVLPGRHTPSMQVFPNGHSAGVLQRGTHTPSSSTLSVSQRVRHAVEAASTTTHAHTRARCSGFTWPQR